MINRYTICKKCHLDIMSAEGAYYIHCRDGKWHYCSTCYNYMLPHIQPERSKRKDDIKHCDSCRCYCKCYVDAVL